MTLMKVKNMKKSLLIILIMLFSAAASLQGDNIKVIDGDSLVVNGVEIRLYGIDAPEYKQYCYRRDGSKYRCGIAAGDYLRRLIKERVTCEIKAKDRFKRSVAVCYVAGEDINLKMVANGWAVAYTRYGDDYKNAEKNACQEKLGIWQGKFMKPEFFRRLKN